MKMVLQEQIVIFLLELKNTDKADACQNEYLKDQIYFYSMHLKQAYLKRIVAQVRHLHTKKNNQPSFNTNQFKSTDIGSAKLQSYNFGREDHIFAEYKLHANLQRAKEEVKSWKDADVLELKKKKWDVSVAVPKTYEKGESKEAKLFKIRHGFNDFGPISSKGNKIYEGTQTRDSFEGWNVSTLGTKKQKNLGYVNLNLKSFENTMKKTNKLTNYERLQERYTTNYKKQKDDFFNNSQVLEDFQKSYVFTYPNSSPEKVNAATLKFFDEIKRVKKRKEVVPNPEIINNRFKANLTKAQKKNRFYKYFHTGKWEKQRESKDDSDGEDDGFGWSCCLKTSKESKGCVKILIDKNKGDYSSYTS